MSESTNIKIVRAAAELFAARGYSAVSTKDIAKLAGVNESTLFCQYGDKRKIMEAAMRYAVEAVTPERVNAALAIRDFEDAIRTLAHSLMERVTVPYMRLQYAFAMEMPRGSVDAFSRDQIRPVHEALVARIRREQRSGRVQSKVHPYAIARALICVLYGHATSVAFWGDEWKRVTRVKPDYVDNYVTIWLRGILVDSEHLRPRK